MARRGTISVTGPNGSAAVEWETVGPATYAVWLLKLPSGVKVAGTEQVVGGWDQLKAAVAEMAGQITARVI